MLLKSKFAQIVFVFGTIFLFSSITFPHCDSVEGPVVKASQKALETGNINYVLVWVQDKDEKEIKEMFDKVNKVRALSPEAKELADMYFFETVVRVHRIGEGVGYTGLKPTGYKPEEGIEAADIAIDKNSVAEVLNHLDKSKHSEVIKYFNEVQSKKNYETNDLKAGREYVEAYVHFIHYVEGLYNGEKNSDGHSEHKH